MMKVRTRQPTEDETPKPAPSEPEPKVLYTPLEARVLEAITEAKPYTEEEVDRIVLGIENHENIFEFLKNMDEFRLPEPLQRLQDAGEQFFRWVDTANPQTFDIQLNRQHFRWTPVNRNTHGRILSDRFFNKHGGIMRGGCLLCWMPGKLYRAWEAHKSRLANAQWQQTSEKYSQKGSGIEFYDPSREGKGAGIRRDDPGFVCEPEDKHPEDVFVELGDYEETPGEHED